MQKQVQHDAKKAQKAQRKSQISSATSKAKQAELEKQKAEKETVSELKEITDKLNSGAITSKDLDQVSKAVAVSQKSRKAKKSVKKVDLYKEAAKLALATDGSDEEPAGEEGQGLTQDEPPKAEEKPKEEPKKEEKPAEKPAEEKKKPEPAVEKIKKATDIFDGLKDDSDDDEDKKGGDPYYDVDLKSVKLGDIDKEFSSMAAEEKDAFMTPLNKKELRKMETSSKSLMGEITTGLESYGKNKFWRNKKFFRDHIGF